MRAAVSSNLLLVNYENVFERVSFTYLPGNRIAWQEADISLRAENRAVFALLGRATAMNLACAMYATHELDRLDCVMYGKCSCYCYKLIPLGHIPLCQSCCHKQAK